ncbi:hypothetical protein SBBP1_210013 [Burkholderiales bacterium]|nr:hypothetical protein SBBP1_210013 [Burkholderiales bacterium]
MPYLPEILTKLLRVRPHEVELLRPARGVAPLAWLLLAGGAVALSAGALACRPGWHRQANLAQQRITVEAALARLGAAPVAPGDGVGRRGATRKGETEALLEADAIVRELDRPWHDLFDQLEAATASGATGVHLVQLAVEPKFTALQLVAEGRDLDKLVRFSQRLTGGAPIRTMTMTHHEWRDALGAHVVSATMRGDLSGTPASAAATATATEAAP